jgi:hypothetical protein
MPNNIRYQDLHQAEVGAIVALETELHDHMKLTTDAFNLIARLVPLTEIHTTPMNLLPKSLHVAVMLLVRLANDLRSVQMLAGTGYPVQALALVASMYEIAYTGAYIGNDESLAQEWLKYDDPTKLFRDVRSLTNEALIKLDLMDRPDKADLEYRNYRMLCWAKHANPILERTWVVHVRGEVVTSTMGPSTSEIAVRFAWFALEYAATYAYIGMGSLIRSHLIAKLPSELGEEVRMIALRRNELDARGRERWPQSPVPETWLRKNF